MARTEAIVVGDLNDGTSRVSEIVGRDSVAVRRPEKATKPKLFYKGAHQATLDPIAARRPPGGLFLWSEQSTGRQQVVSGHPGAPNNAAAAMLATTSRTARPGTPHSLYTWTKGMPQAPTCCRRCPAAGRVEASAPALGADPRGRVPWRRSVC
jgi:hypothetical protein